MQRVSDLIWMAQGVSKLGQSAFQITFDEVIHYAKSSSIPQAAFGCFTKATNSKNEFDLSDLDMELDFPDDIPSDEVSAQTLAQSQTHNATTTTTIPLSNSFNSKRNYSTQSHHLNSLIQYKCWQGHFASPMIKNSQRNISTSVKLSAITAKELAELAKVQQSRIITPKSQNGNGKSFADKMEQKLGREAQQQKVPATRIARLASFGELAAGIAINTMTEAVKRTVGISSATDANNPYGNALLNEENMAKIVSTLCKVRGAALKLGQMLSMQDDSIIDPKLLEVFERVRQSADFMPPSQMKKVLMQEFGHDWRKQIKEFNDKPFAAASIGQVHRAVLFDGREVAMKIQYPGVADSIDSDINNLVTLLKFWDIFPKQMYMDQFIEVARREMAWECDYEREAEYSNIFREALKDEEMYGVPKIIPELSTKRVLTTDLISGVPINQASELGQNERNFIAAALLRLVLREIFDMRCMQTDPNWSNFFYNEEQQKIWLLDFGASRRYSKQFVDDYIEVVKGAADDDYDKVLEMSKRLGFLTGYEPKVMEDAHVDAIMILGEPFKTDDVFDFGAQSTSRRIVGHIPTFLKHRLTPPPEESYSLHRKLSGVFLIACKLQAKFACQKMFQEIYDNYWQTPDS